MPKLVHPWEDELNRIAAIELWRDAVMRANRRRSLATCAATMAKEPHPTWQCSLLHLTLKERLQEFLEEVAHRRWGRTWSEDDMWDALKLLDFTITQGRDALLTAHERMLEHVASGCGLIRPSCAYHSPPTWALSPYGSGLAAELQGTGAGWEGVEAESRPSSPTPSLAVSTVLNGQVPIRRRWSDTDLLARGEGREAGSGDTVTVRFDADTPEKRELLAKDERQLARCARVREWGAGCDGRGWFAMAQNENSDAAGTCRSRSGHEDTLSPPPSSADSIDTRDGRAQRKRHRVTFADG
ncbi:hypothetical protein OC834_005831 [Tilletia horrida]|nr:hypothetical protein OC834_005831 [Tilletia horrida]